MGEGLHESVKVAKRAEKKSKEIMAAAAHCWI
jgi:hypothetical protein